MAQGRRVLAHLRHCEACQAVRADRGRGHLGAHAYLTCHSRRQSRRSGRGATPSTVMPARTQTCASRSVCAIVWASRRMMAAAAVILIVAGRTGAAVGACREPWRDARPRRGGRASTCSTSSRRRDAAGPAIRKTRTDAGRARARARACRAGGAAGDGASDRDGGLMAALPDRDTLDQAELDARLVLSDASLDLLRGIHVSSTQKAVRVEGVLPASPRRRVVAPPQRAAVRARRAALGAGGVRWRRGVPRRRR